MGVTVGPSQGPRGVSGATGATGATGPTGATGAAGGGSSSITRMTSGNLIGGTSVLAVMPGMSAPITTGVHYEGELVVWCVSEIPTDGIKFDLAGGSGTVDALWSAGVSVAGTNTAGSGKQGANLADVINWTVIDGTSAVVMIRFAFETITSGTLIPQCAQNSAGGDLIVSGNSYFKVEAISN